MSTSPGHFVSGKGSVGRLLKLDPETRLLTEWGANIVTGERLTDGTPVVRVRSGDTGDVVTEVRIPIRPGNAVVVGNELLVTGFDAAGMTTDPGLFRIDMQTWEGAFLASTGPTSNDTGSIVARMVMVSSDATAVVSALCEVDACDVDLLAPADWSRVALLKGADYPAALTAKVLITVSEQSDRMAAYALATGSLLWERDGDEFQHFYLADDSTLVVGYIANGAEYRVSRMDPLTGKEDQLTATPVGQWSLWRQLSGATTAALGPTFRLSEALGPLGQADASFSLLDLATGKVTPADQKVTVVK